MFKRNFSLATVRLRQCASSFSYHVSETLSTLRYKGIIGYNVLEGIITDNTLAD